MKRAMVIAHQGAERERPSNTVASFKRAAELGVGSEMDVVAEKSGMPIIMHDAKVDRTTNGAGEVAQLEWAYISTLRATNYAPWNTSPWKDERVPSLDQALAAAGVTGLPVQLDMHYVPTKEQFDQVWECLEKHDLVERAIILGGTQALGHQLGCRHDHDEPSGRTAGLASEPLREVRQGHPYG